MSTHKHDISIKGPGCAGSIPDAPALLSRCFCSSALCVDELTRRRSLETKGRKLLGSEFDAAGEMKKVTIEGLRGPARRQGRRQRQLGGV